MASFTCTIRGGDPATCDASGGAPPTGMGSWSSAAPVGEISPSFRCPVILHFVEITNVAQATCSSFLKIKIKIAF
jgi:hypothetical protein